MLPYRNITGDSPLNKTTGAIWQRTSCITAITMNIERVKQFIKEVRWGFLATTDGRISCSTSVPVRVSVRVSPCFCLCLSVFLSVPVRVYEILRRYIEDESVDLVHLDPPFVWRAGCHCEAEGRGNLVFPLLLCSCALEFTRLRRAQR